MRRELNEIEYFNWCFGQPYNMVVAVQLRGEVRPERLRAALASAQRRHPMLAVNTEPGPRGIPWFSSEGVGEIPLTLVRDAEPEAAEQLFERELTAKFEMERRGARPPLIRVALLLPRDAARPCDLVITVQHLIADGLSLVFLLRDLIHFMDEPGAPIEVLDVPASDEDLLPARVLRHTPKTQLRFWVVLAAMKVYAFVRFLGRTAAARKPHLQRRLTWELTPEQTARLRARCHQERVSVQSAICAPFLRDFTAVQTPVNLRGMLARPVGEAVGLFVGAALVQTRWRARRGFWANARRFHRRLRKAMRDPFSIFRLFSKAVPARLFEKLGNVMLQLTTRGRPFGVTNLGELDRKGLLLEGASVKLESFYGAATAIIDASILTVYTIRGRMRLHLLANEVAPDEAAVRRDADRAVKLLLASVEV